MCGANLWNITLTLHHDMQTVGLLIDLSFVSPLKRAAIAYRRGSSVEGLVVNAKSKAGSQWDLVPTCNNTCTCQHVEVNFNLLYFVNVILLARLTFIN